MSVLNWGLIQDGGVFESLAHAILYTEDPGTILFGRPGKDSGQDARSQNGNTVYQAKYRKNLDMDNAKRIAKEELKKIKRYRQPDNENYRHWENADKWILIANLSINSNDEKNWGDQVVPLFQEAGLEAECWGIEQLERILETHPEIRNVFFGGENRVFISLKEARDLLSDSCIGGALFDKPLVGREEALKTIMDFSKSTNERILPIIGPSGIGKTRLLYESLTVLVEDGWRVLWALPVTMSGSTQWFNLLNSSQKTCVAIDDLYDANLLRLVIEQLAATERSNWRAIFTSRIENTKLLEKSMKNKSVYKPIELGPLNEAESKDLVRACFGNTCDLSDKYLHSMYSATKGNPVWLCLMAKSLRMGKSADSFLLAAADHVETYIDSCLEAFEASKREPAKNVLQWLSLWGTIRVDEENIDEGKFRFLEETQGINKQTTRKLLEDMARFRLVRNWGVGKRFFAVEPPILRQQILAHWLIHKDDGLYVVNDQGKNLIAGLVGRKIPAVDSIIQALSHMAATQLSDAVAVSLLKPFFNQMKVIAEGEDILEQYSVVELVTKAGAADPEGALEILKEVRENPTEDKTINLPIWGNQTFTHKALKEKLPWELFQITEYVTSSSVALRYVEEFKYFLEEENVSLSFESGKGPKELLKRLLCQGYNQELFAQSVLETVEQGLVDSGDTPIILILAKCLLDPVRESMGWVANWTITITRWAIVPGSEPWCRTEKIRSKILEAFEQTKDIKFRNNLWEIWTEAHQAWHRAILHEGLKEGVATSYRDVLEKDLENCLKILESLPKPQSTEELARARKMWSWYLEYGGDMDPVDLARECEKFYTKSSKWCFPNFFSFEADEKVATETKRIADFLLGPTQSSEAINSFFSQADEYLKASTQDCTNGKRSMIHLANVCARSSSLDIMGSDVNLALYLRDILGKEKLHGGDRLAWEFAVALSREFLLKIKESEVADFVSGLGELLKIVKPKSQFLYQLYLDANPREVGDLAKEELIFVLKYESEFSEKECWLKLLGFFYSVDVNEVLNRFDEYLENKKDSISASNSIIYFIRQSYHRVICCEWKPDEQLLKWIIDKIIEFELDGVILEMYELEQLRSKAGFHLNMKQLTELILSRLQLKSQDFEPSFSILPHKFSIEKWILFDNPDLQEKNAFGDFCQLTLEPGFLASYWIPKYIFQIDPSGKYVAEFVKEHLENSPEIGVDELSRLGCLAEAYAEDSFAWVGIAGPICDKVQKMDRECRDQIYFSLSKKETGAMRSTLGEVPPHYVEALKFAEHLLETEDPKSSLYEYRKWARDIANSTLRWQKASAEEDRYD